MTTTVPRRVPWRGFSDAAPRISLELDGPIIALTDGTVHSRCAVALAELLRARTGRRVKLLSIVEQSAATRAAGSADAALEERRERVMGVARELGGATADWDVHVRHGRRLGEAVRDYAAAQGARLIVIARTSHRLAEEVRARSSVLDVIEHSEKPVYVVAPESVAVASSALVGAELGPGALRVARITASLVAPGADVTLVHIANCLEEADLLKAAERNIENARLSLDVGDGGLHTSTRVRCVAHARATDVAEELLRLADEQSVGLMAVGTVQLTQRSATARHRRSVSAKILRRAGCSVLVVPNAGRSLEPAE